LGLGKKPIENQKSKIGNWEDWLGTERARSNSSGARCETITTLPFGDGAVTSGTCTPTPSFFTGLERDAESGLDHTLNRQYPSSLGRWLTPDPAGKEAVQIDDPQTWNMYAYVRNNPLTLTDPYGDSWFTDFLEASVNCFRYGSCHTTEVIAERRVDRFLSSLAIGNRYLTPSEKEDYKSKLFGNLSPAEQIKAVDFYNSQFQHIPGEDLGPPAAPAGPGLGPAPRNATETLEDIDRTGRPPAGTQGGQTFQNDGRGGGQILPRADAKGNPIIYREWDVNPSGGGPRGPERIVTGSDGSAYYTADHYQTFIRMR
jgi:RHS repeat-associated protein